jgi:hypothetical protein
VLARIHFAHRTRAAWRAIARRFAGEIDCMRVAALLMPPRRPSATAAGFFARVVFVLDRLSIVGYLSIGPFAIDSHYVSDVYFVHDIDTDRRDCRSLAARDI